MAATAAIVTAVAAVAGAGVTAANAAGAFGGPELDDIPDPTDIADPAIQKAREAEALAARRRRGIQSTIQTQSGLGTVEPLTNRPSLG